MKRGVVLDWETADKITVDVLKDQLAILKEDVREHLEDGKWMHAEDLQLNLTVYIPALETLIPYFGG